MSGDMASFNDVIRANHRDSGAVGPAPYCLRIPVAPPAAPSPRPPADCLHVRRYAPPNWWSSEGVLKKRRLIERRGLPEFRGWRFVTLTLDRERFAHDPLAAYLAGKDHMRRFLLAARKAALWSDSARWCWKLEFQADGWAHWHLLVERTEKMTVEELGTLAKLWALGRTNVEMVSSGEFLYSFKYAFKPVLQTEEASEAFLDDSPQSCLPDWFADYYVPAVPPAADGCDGEPPKTFSRVRFWQTSRGFYVGRDDSEPKESPPKTKSFVPWRVRDVVKLSESFAQVVARDSRGRSVVSAVVAFVGGFGSLMASAGWYAADFKAVFLGAQDFLLPGHVLRTKIEPHQSCILNQIQQKNHLTVHRASLLRDRGELLRTC